MKMLHRLPFFRPLLACLTLILAGIFLAGCGKKDETPAEASARPVKVLTLSNAEASAPLEFPALVRARNSVELAFNVPGQVTELTAIEGEPVEEGTLLASLDNTEYRARMEAAEAALELAQTEFDRFSDLSVSGAVAVAELDQKRAALQAAKSELELVRKNFEDTVLRAPFNGVVASRMVQRFANVQAKQPVLIFQSLLPLDIVIDVPEPLILRSTGERAYPPRTVVTFDGLPGVELPVSFREVSTEADPQTQTFRVTFSLEETQGRTVLPGMSALLIAERRAVEGGTVFLLPPLSLLTAPDGRRYVYVYDPETGTAQERDVEVGLLRDEGVEVLGGLAEGDQVIVAGVSQLSPGLKVRPHGE